MKFSGMSFVHGCNIYSDHYKLKIYERQGRTKYKITPRKVRKIPPFLLLFPLIDILFLSSALVIAAMAYIVAMIPPEVTAVGEEATGVLDSFYSMIAPYEPWISYAGVAFFFIGYSVIIIGILLRIRRWHGCEHKLIAAGEDNRPYEAKEYSPIHDRCGTTYMLTIFTIVGASLLFFRFPIMTAVAVFLFMESRYFHDYNKPGIILGRLIQKFNALEPEGYKLHVGMKGMNELLKLENDHK